MQKNEILLKLKKEYFVIEECFLILNERDEKKYQYFMKFLQNEILRVEQELKSGKSYEIKNIYKTGSFIDLLLKFIAVELLINENYVIKNNNYKTMIEKK